MPRTRDNHDRKRPHIERLRSPTDAGKAGLRAVATTQNKMLRDE